MSSKFFLLIALAVPLGSCEPLRGVVSEKESTSSIDVACVDAALRKTFGNIERWDYVSDGGGYPNGAEVAQLAYFQSDDGLGWATLRIGGGEGNVIRVEHSFTGMGAKLPEHDFPLAFRAMEKATATIRVSCNLNLSDMPLKSVGQHIDGLKQSNWNGS